MSIIRSESIKELAVALCKAQSELDKAKKSSTNPHFRSKFANLESVIDASREALTKNGLSTAQLVGSNNGGQTTLTTILMHSSGEYLESTVVLATTKTGPQEIGSCLTYYKRYCLTAIIGLADTDDDAESTEGRPNGHKPDTSPPAAFKHVPNLAPTHPISSGDFLMPFGKTKGCMIKSLTLAEVKSAVEWAAQKGKFFEFVKAATEYLRECEAIMSSKINESDMAPVFDPDDKIPF